VFGYTLCWDISQRDPWGPRPPEHAQHPQGLRQLHALGPWIVTRDELPEPQDVRIESS